VVTNKFGPFVPSSTGDKNLNFCACLHLCCSNTSKALCTSKACALSWYNCAVADCSQIVRVLRVNPQVSRNPPRASGGRTPVPPSCATLFCDWFALSHFSCHTC